MIRIPLTAIRDNPFQTRTQYGGIAELADSIFRMREMQQATSGLVQVPPARLYDVEARQPLDPANLDDDNELLALLRGDLVIVQLVAGHRRFRAFQYLLSKGLGFCDEYDTFPVELAVYDDAAMADLVWSENHDRADLSAIEEAEALQRDMQAFGWTQSEIGFRRNMSRPAVANKLRLLKLPEAAQAAIRSGALTERHGRVLLTAIGYSDKIYQAVATQVLPLPVTDDAAAKARDLAGHCNSFNRTWQGDYRRCMACGAEHAYLVARRKDDFKQCVALCEACWRIVTDWQPPSVAQTETLLKNSIVHNSETLNERIFPLDVEIGKPISGPAVVRQTLCTDCPAIYNDDHISRCTDPECFKFKRESWRGVLRNCLKENLKSRWPDSYYKVVTIFGGSSGYDFHAQDAMDRYLTEHVCTPDCPRLRFCHYPYKFGNSNKIKLTNDPFVLNCDNSQSRAACARRLNKDEQAKADLAEHNAGLAGAVERRAAASALRKRAIVSLAAALHTGQEGAIKAVAESMNRHKGDPYLVVADLVLDRAYLLGLDYYLWEKPESEEKFRKTLGDKMGQWGVPLLASAEEIGEKLTKIERFLNENAELPPEQISGNLDNLEKLDEQTNTALSQKIISDADFEKLLLWNVQLVNRLRRLDASRLVNVFGSVSRETEEQTA